MIYFLRVWQVAFAFSFRISNLRHKRQLALSALLVSLLLVGCSGDSVVGPPQITTGSIEGLVTDEEGNPLPHVELVLDRTNSVSPRVLYRTTNLDGIFRFGNIGQGDYELSLSIPPRAEAVSVFPVSVTVVDDEIATVNFTLRTIATASFEVLQDRIRNEIGVAPSDPGERLYHANEPDTMRAILAPGGDHVTLGEWQEAAGTIRATCAGGHGTRYHVTLTGLIPRGVYSVRHDLLEYYWEFDPILIGSGVIGPADGTQSTFTASASGEGTVLATTPPGALSGEGSAPACTLIRNDVIVLLVTYHMDDTSTETAPRASWVDHLRLSL